MIEPKTHPIIATTNILYKLSCFVLEIVSHKLIIPKKANDTPPIIMFSFSDRLKKIFKIPSNTTIIVNNISALVMISDLFFMIYSLKALFGI